MSVGAALAEARERAELTVRQLSERTHIREGVIESMERDDFSVGDFYARGHIRAVASALGLDPDDLVRQYDQEHADGRGPVRASAVFKGDLLRERARRASGWTMAVGVALAVVVVFVIVRILGGSGGEKTGQTAARLPVTAPHAQAGDERRHEKKTIEEAVAPGLVVVKVTARKPAWINVKDAEGKSIFQGTLPEGKTTTYSAKDKVRMVIGDAGAVRLEVNGKDLGTPGKDGQMIRRTFGADGPSHR